MPAVSKYDPQTVETALHVLAANQGNSVKASELLALQGTHIGSSTLTRWKNDNHAERYRKIQADRAPLLEAQAITTSLELVALYGTIEQRAAELLNEKLDDLPPKELANTVSKLAVAKGINTDKALLLQGRPTSVTEHRDTTEIMRALQQLNPSLVVESTATDITPTKPALG